ncbi:MAG TPA: hypothetical protein VGM44_05720, partial [Polyangiaceae bacterium]
VSDAEDAARRLIDIGESTSDVKGAMARCLNRAEDKLNTLRAAFAPIQDSAVPERMVLQTRIQEYSSLASSLRERLSEFREAAAPSAAPSVEIPAARPKSGGVGFALPLIGVLVLGGGAAALFMMKKEPPSATLNAAAAADSATAAPIATATTVAPATAIAAAAPSQSATPAKAGHATKPHLLKNK